MNPNHPIFEELEDLAANSGWVHGLARRLVADAHLAEDVVQDAWVEALTHGGEAGSSLSAWLAGVVKHVARGRIRSASRQRQREERSARPAEASSASVTSERLEQQGLLIKSVLALREPYRNAIVMRYIDERTPSKIAAELQVPVATVNSRIARGLEFLREELMRAHGGDETRWLSALVSLSGVSSKDGVVLLGAALMKSKITVASGLFLILFGSWWVTSEALELENEPVVGLSATQELEPELPAASSEEVARRTQGVPGSSRSTVGEVPGSEGAFLVRIIDGESGAPAAGATLFALDPPQVWGDPEQVALQRLRFNLEESIEWVCSQGKSYRADEGGEVRLPASYTDWGLCARWEGKTATTMNLPGTALERTLTLWPHAEIHVRVVDEAGRPLIGIGVAVAPQNEPFVFARSRTDGTGEAVLRPWMVRGEMLSKFDVEHLLVSIDGPLAVPVSEPLHLAGRLEATVELISTALGTLELELLETESRLLPDGTAVAISVAEEYETLPSRLRSGISVARILNGRATFEHVGVGLELTLSVPLAAHQDPWEAKVVGPTQPFERAHRRIVVGLERHEYEGVALGEDRTPLADSRFRVTYSDGSGSGHLWEQETDAEGRFHFEVTGFGGPPAGKFQFVPMREEPSRIEVVLQIDELGDSASPHDLGQIWFGPEPRPILSGIVIDPFGRPAPDVWVSWGSGPARSAGAPEGGPRRKPEITDSDGRFVFHGEFGHEEVWLNVFASGRWRHEPQRILAPSMTVELQLTGPGSLEGRILVDENVDMSEVVVGLWNLDQGVPESILSGRWEIESGVRPDGSFEIRALDTGRYALSLSLAHNGGMLARIDGIEVRSDGTNDPRLDPIDLRGRLRSIEVEVLNANGFPVMADVWFVPDEGRPVELGQVGLNPTIVIGREAQGCLLGLVGPALPAYQRLGAADSYELHSPAGQEIEVRWAAARPLSDFNARFEVELDPVDQPRLGDGLDLARKFQFRLSDRKVTLWSDRGSPLLLPGPGEYRVSWTARRKTADGEERDFWSAPQRDGGIIRIDPSQTVLELAPDEAWAAGEDK